MITPSRIPVLFDASRLAIAGIVIALFAALAGPASAEDYKAGDLTIEQPWSRATPAAAQVASGYMVIRNAGATADRLVSISSAISDKAEIHQMSVDDKGVMTMREVEGGLEIPAGGEVELKPSAYHVMFIGLKQPPREGERFAATLTFEKAGEVVVEFAVGNMSGGSMGGMKMDGGGAGQGTMGTMKSGG